MGGTYKIMKENAEKGTAELQMICCMRCENLLDEIEKHIGNMNNHVKRKHKEVVAIIDCGQKWIEDIVTMMEQEGYIVIH